MKVFLSWSGQRSRLVAAAFKDWLPMILQYSVPWLSDKDIAAGDRWSLVIGKELEQASFGILCVTKENSSSSWLNFEAGALSKSLDTGSVCPYLVGLDHSEISGPLAQFQGKKAERNDTLGLVLSINSKAPAPVAENYIERLFNLLWPDLSSRLSAIPKTEEEKSTRRSEREILEELVSTVRSLDFRLREQMSPYLDQGAENRTLFSTLLIRAFNIPGRMSRITETIKKAGGSILTMQPEEFESGESQLEVKLAVHDQKLAYLISQLRMLPGVREVEHVPEERQVE